jgi:hypothetical protein
VLPRGKRRENVRLIAFFSYFLIKEMIPSLFVLLALFTDQEMSKILGLNIPVFGAIVSSVGVVLIALTAGIVVCCCRKRAVQRRNNTNCAGTVAVSSINIIKSFQAFTLLCRVGFDLFLQLA